MFEFFAIKTELDITGVLISEGIDRTAAKLLAPLMLEAVKGKVLLPLYKVEWAHDNVFNEIRINIKLKEE